MITCHWVADRLAIYLAGELDARLAAKIAAHLVRCKRCTLLAEQLTEANNQVQTLFQEPIIVPPTLDSRVMQAVRALPAPLAPAHVPSRSWQPRWALPIGAIGLAAACGFCGFCVGRMPAHLPEMDITALTKNHRVVEASMLGPIETVQTSLKFPLYQPKPVNACDLQGGSYCKVQGMPAAHLSYNWQGQAVSLFEMDASKVSPPALQPKVRNDHYVTVGERDGYAYALWCSGKTQCVLVSRTTPQNLLTLASNMIGAKK
jgi:anti-sigma factor RsiW